MSTQKDLAKLGVEQLERETKDEWTQYQSLARRTVEASVRIGELLLALHAKMKHGEWQPCLDRLGIKEPTARRLMKIAENGPFVLAALEQAPDLTQQAVERLIAERDFKGLQSDLPPEKEATQALKRVKTKRAGVKDARQNEAALRRDVAVLEELIQREPQSKTVVRSLFFLKEKVKEMLQAHEKAIAADTEPTAGDNIAPIFRQVGEPPTTSSGAGRATTR